MFIQDLALNNLQWFICHKTQPNKNRMRNETRIATKETKFYRKMCKNSK